MFTISQLLTYIIFRFSNFHEKNQHIFSSILFFQRISVISVTLSVNTSYEPEQQHCIVLQITTWRNHTLRQFWPDSKNTKKSGHPQIWNLAEELFAYMLKLLFLACSNMFQNIGCLLVFYNFTIKSSHFLDIVKKQI